MQDMKTHLEKLLQDAAECEMISQLATDASKRDLFNRLALHLKVLADEVERAIQNATDQASAGQAGVHKIH